MKKKISLLFCALAFFGSMQAAGYKAAMVDSTSGVVGRAFSAPAGSVARVLQDIDAALVSGQYNRALMLERALAPQTVGMMLPQGSQLASPSVQAAPAANDASSQQQQSSASTQAAAQTPAITSAATSTTTSTTTPAASTSSSSGSVSDSSSPSPQASTPSSTTSTTSSSSTSSAPAQASSTPTQTQTAPTQVPFQPFSQSQLDALVTDMNNAVVAPYDQIADLWSSQPSACAAQYKAQLDVTVAWAYKYALFFAQPEWQALANKFYNNVIDSWSGCQKPIRIRRIGSGIQGRDYRQYYDQLIAALESMKRSLSGVHQQDIAALQAKVQGARDKYAPA